MLVAHTARGVSQDWPWGRRRRLGTSARGGVRVARRQAGVAAGERGVAPASAYRWWRRHYWSRRRVPWFRLPRLLVEAMRLLVDAPM